MKVSNLIYSYWNDFVNLIFPRVCVHCNSVLIYQENHLCTKCRLSLPKTNYHLKSDNPIQLKFIYEPKVHQACTYLHFNKKGIAQSLIHELKYRDQPELGVLIGNWYAHDLTTCGWPIDMIIPIPLHKSKLKRRGFNQSERFAAGLSEVLGWPVLDDLIIRKRRTSTQTKKTKVERWQNVNSIYALKTSGGVFEKNVLIVDDVLTTGATIGEMIQLLVNNGVGSIYIATIAAGK
ncbi:MAG: ComF family protein [Marinoscillum sp.]